MCVMVLYCFGAAFYSPVHEFENIFLALFLMSFGIGGEGGFYLIALELGGGGGV